MVVQLSSVDPLKIRELKAAAGKYVYSSRTKWLHIDGKTQVDHFESIREELRYYNRHLIGKKRLCDRVKPILSELWKLQHENISHYYAYYRNRNSV